MLLKNVESNFLFVHPRCPRFYVLRILFFHSMKHSIIYHFHIHGNYIAGDFADIHNNPNSTFCQHQPSTAAPADEAEESDIIPISPQAPCPFLVPDKLDELRLYTPEQFADLFCHAAESDAKTLAAFLKKYYQLGVLDFQDKDKKQIFAELHMTFPSMRPYSYRNFTAYF